LEEEGGEEIMATKFGKPKSAFSRKGPGEAQRSAKAKRKPTTHRRAPVDLATGKPTQPATIFQRALKFATRAERREIPATTQEKRLESISTTAEKGIGGASRGTRPGGQIDIERERRKTVGPSGFTQQTKRQGAMSLLEKQRKGIRTTAADVPSAKRRLDPGKTIQAPGALKATVTTIRKGGKEDLGEFRVVGGKPPPPKKRKKKPGRKIPKRAPTFMEMLGGIFK